MTGARSTFFEDSKKTPNKGFFLDKNKKTLERSTSKYAWAPGEPVPYARLAETFARIEATPGRLESTRIAADLFCAVIDTTPGDLLATVCLTTNQVCLLLASLFRVSPLTRDAADRAGL